MPFIVHVPGDYPTIAEAMNHVIPTDTITLDPGYSGETAIVTVNDLFLNGSATNQNITLQLAAGITAITLSGSAPFAVVDNSGANALVGNSADNDFTVTNGLDTVDGLTGIDRLVVDYSMATNAIGTLVTHPITTDTLDGTAGSYTDTVARTVIFDNINNIDVRGGTGNDALTTGAGNDNLRGGPGADALDGRSGIDTADYSTSSSGVNVDLQSGMGTGGEAQGDTLVSIENLIGGGAGDTLAGDGNANTLNGKGGADTLTGRAGADVFAFDPAAYTDALSGIFDRITDFNPGEGDRLDLSALPFDSGQPVSSLVRIVEDPSTTFATVQIDPDGAANGANWATIARLDGLQHGAAVDVGLAGQTVTVSVTPAITDLEEEEGFHAPNFKVLGDFSGDGNSDLLWLNDSGQELVWNLAGSQKFGAFGWPEVTSDWHALGFGDFSGDHTSDVLWHNDSGQNLLWLIRGNEITAGLNLPSTTSDWQAAGIGDFNRDGTRDVLWRNDSGQNSIWTLNGGQQTGSLGLAAVTSDWRVAAVGDFNGDQISDILWHHANGQNVIWQMQSDGQHAGFDLPSTTSDWHIASIGDFGPDGTSDILWHNESGQNLIWTIRNSQKTDGISLPTTTSDWHLAGVGDTNADSISDLVWHDDSGQNAIWQIHNGQVTGFALPTTTTDWHLVA